VKVSVIIPHYNADRFIHEALDSVGFQTGHDVYELIVVDDGSTPESWSWTVKSCAGFHFPAQCWIRFTENRGQGFALNRGIERATGDIVMFLDADDVWERDKVLLQLKALADRRVDAVVGHAREQRYREMSGPPKPARLMSALAIRHANIPSFREDLGAGMTIEWFARAEDRGLNIVMLDEVIFYRRLHDQNYGVVHKERAKTEYMNAIRIIEGRRRGKADAR
jgi:glycosyltransferase involved in cell wall biosynthesis